MHENRYSLSYRKRRHDAENHVHICALRHSGSRCKIARPHQGACLLLGVLFYFPKLSLFVSSYVKMKTFCSF